MHPDAPAIKHLKPQGSGSLNLTRYVAWALPREGEDRTKGMYAHYRQTESTSGRYKHYRGRVTRVCDGGQAPARAFMGKAGPEAPGKPAVGPTHQPLLTNRFGRWIEVKALGASAAQTALVNEKNTTFARHCPPSLFCLPPVTFGAIGHPWRNLSPGDPHVKTSLSYTP
jgi:hypothetical protein